MSDPLIRSEGAKTSKPGVGGPAASDDRADFGPVPEANRPGHHEPEEQDRPDLDAFAERLGIVTEDQSSSGPPQEAAAPDAVVAVTADDESMSAETPAGSVPGRSVALWIGTRAFLGPWIVAGRAAEALQNAIGRRLGTGEEPERPRRGR